MSKKPLFLIVARDRYPLFRVDVTVLFSKYLTSRFAFDWLIPAKNRGRSFVKVRKGETFNVMATGGVWGGLDFVRGHGGRIIGVLRRQYDLVQCRDCVVMSALYAVAARVARRNFVYWMTFPFEDDYVARAHMLAARGRLSAVPRWCIGVLGRFLLRRITLPLSEAIFVQSEKMRLIVADKYCVPLDKLIPVPMGVDLADFSPERVMPAIHPFYDNRRVALYLGALDASRQMEVPARGLALAMQERQDLVFVAIGAASAAERNDLRRVFEAVGVAERILFLDQMPLAEALSHVRRADVCLSSVPATPMLEMSTPTKLCEYLAMGRRVVANRLPDHEWVIKGTGLGTLTNFDVMSFRDGILQALDAGEPSKHEAAAAAAWLSANRDYRGLSTMVGEVYERILLNRVPSFLSLPRR